MHQTTIELSGQQTVHQPSDLSRGRLKNPFNVFFLISPHRGRQYSDFCLLNSDFILSQYTIYDILYTNAIQNPQSKIQNEASLPRKLVCIANRNQPTIDHVLLTNHETRITNHNSTLPRKPLSLQTDALPVPSKVEGRRPERSRTGQTQHLQLKTKNSALPPIPSCTNRTICTICTYTPKASFSFLHFDF